MNSVMRFIVWGTIPLGSLIGGGLASSIGLKQTLIVSGIGSCLACLPVAFSSVRDVRELPEQVEDVALEPLLADAALVPSQLPGA